MRKIRTLTSPFRLSRQHQEPFPTCTCEDGYCWHRPCDDIVGIVHVIEVQESRSIIVDTNRMVAKQYDVLLVTSDNDGDDARRRVRIRRP